MTRILDLWKIFGWLGEFEVALVICTEYDLYLWSIRCDIFVACDDVDRDADIESFQCCHDVRVWMDADTVVLIVVDIDMGLSYRTGSRQEDTITIIVDTDLPHLHEEIFRIGESILGAYHYDRLWRSMDPWISENKSYKTLDSIVVAQTIDSGSLGDDRPGSSEICHRRIVEVGSDTTTRIRETLMTDIVDRES